MPNLINAQRMFYDSGSYVEWDGVDFGKVNTMFQMYAFS